MAYFLSPILNDQQFDANGDPRAGALITTYLAGTLTPVTTYKTSTGTAQSNPIVLDSSGNFPNGTQLWLLSGLTYKFVITDSTGANSRTYDNITGIGDNAATADEWVLYAATPTYVTATSFSVVGDQTNIFQASRRLKSTNTGGTVYSTISSSAFLAGITTVTVVNTSGVLDSGLSQVSYGLLSSINPSVPAIYARTDALSIYTTGGTSTAYTLTPSPAISAYAIGESFFVNFNAASGASPTLTISGIATPPNLVKQNADGTFTNIASGEIPANHRSRVTLVSTTQALIEEMPQKLTLGTAVATISGTAIDFTGIPSWVKRVTVMFNGVSTNGTSLVVLTLGTSGGLETSGYLGSSSQISNGVSPIVVNFTANILVEGGASATAIRHGAITLSLLGSNTWTITGTIGRSDVAVNQSIGGIKPLAGALDRIRLTTAGGADTFDAGSINILYEG